MFLRDSETRNAFFSKPGNRELNEELEWKDLRAKAKKMGIENWNKKTREQLQKEVANDNCGHDSFGG